MIWVKFVEYSTKKSSSGVKNLENIFKIGQVWLFFTHFLFIKGSTFYVEKWGLGKSSFGFVQHFLARQFQRLLQVILTVITKFAALCVWIVVPIIFDTSHSGNGRALLYFWCRWKGLADAAATSGQCNKLKPFLESNVAKPLAWKKWQLFQFGL